MSAAAAMMRSHALLTAEALAFAAEVRQAQRVLYLFWKLMLWTCELVEWALRERRRG